MHSDCGINLQRLQVDGGMSSNNLLLQMQADVLGIPVVRPSMVETTGKWEQRPSFDFFFRLTNCHCDDTLGLIGQFVFRSSRSRLRCRQSLGYLDV